MTVIRPAVAGDSEEVAGLAAALAQSFPFSRAAFDATFPGLIDNPDAALLVAVDGTEIAGYLLGFRHGTFYAGGPTAMVEEILVRPADRATGIGRQLMTAFENWAAGCVLISLATRRAVPFYLALGYEESATYFRKLTG